VILSGVSQISSITISMPIIYNYKYNFNDYNNGFGNLKNEFIIRFKNKSLKNSKD